MAATAHRCRTKDTKGKGQYRHSVPNYNRASSSNRFEPRRVGASKAVAHGMGRCHPQYSGWDGRWTRKPTEFTNDFFLVLLREDWHEDVAASTGRSQYFNTDKTLMMLNTDMELVRDPGFRHWVEVYTDSGHFRRSFSAAFAKLLELGVRRDETGAVLWRE